MNVEAGTAVYFLLRGMTIFGLFFSLFMTGTVQSVGRAVHGSPGQFMHGPGPFMKRLCVMTGPEQGYFPGMGL